MDQYALLLERISKSSGIPLEEVEQKVEAKKEKLSGLISREGAAQIIAAELGVNFEDADMKIREVLSGMRKVNLVGKIVTVFPIREFEREGRQGKVLNFILGDETGTLRTVLWDVNHIALFEKEELQEGDVIEIKNATCRESGEVHLSGFSELKKSTQTITEVVSQPAAEETTLDKAVQGRGIKVRGTVVQIFQPRFYTVCSECNKKAVQEGDTYTCAEHGTVQTKERAILNFVLDDGTEAMRIVMFSDQIAQITTEEELKDPEKALLFRDDFLGTEIYLTGAVKRNQLFNNLEIITNSIEKVNVDTLITELEAAA